MCLWLSHTGCAAGESDGGETENGTADRSKTSSADRSKYNSAERSKTSSAERSKYNSADRSKLSSADRRTDRTDTLSIITDGVADAADSTNV